MRGDVVARAMRLIADGTVDRDGVTGLAARLGYTTRQLERLLQAEVGANPLALARAQRTQTARVLIETTDLPFGDVAFAAGLLQHPAVQRHRARGLRPHPDRAAPTGADRFGRDDAVGTGVHCRCGCRYARRSPTRGCSATWRPPRCRASRRCATAPTGARCDCRTGNGHRQPDAAPDHVRCGWCSTTSATCPRRSPAVGGCSTSTPTPRRSSTR